MKNEGQAGHTTSKTLESRRREKQFKLVSVSAGFSFADGKATILSLNSRLSHGEVENDDVIDTLKNNLVEI